MAPRGKLGEHGVDYLVFIVQVVSLHPNTEEVVHFKYLSKEKKKFIRKVRKVEMKLHQQMNKHRPFSNQEKMKCFVVTLAET